MKKLFLLVIILLIGVALKAQDEGDLWSKPNWKLYEDSIQRRDSIFRRLAFDKISAQFEDIEYRYITDEEDSLFYDEKHNKIILIGFIQTDLFEREYLEESMEEIRQDYVIYKSVNLIKHYYAYLVHDNEKDKYQIVVTLYNLKEALITKTD